MTHIEEEMIFDAWAALKEASNVLIPVVPKDNRAAVEAWNHGIYGTVINLEALLGIDGIERGKARHAKIKAAYEAYDKAHPTK